MFKVLVFSINKHGLIKGINKFLKNINRYKKELKKRKSNAKYNALNNFKSMI